MEDPIRSIALRYFYKETEGEIYQHFCDPDRLYFFQYTNNNKPVQHRYKGYIEKLDESIPENERCKGLLSNPVKIQIKYFPFIKKWSEPVDATSSGLALFLMINLVKILSVFLLIWTFLRK
ncbi:MAG: hypothetical protein M3Q56_02980 [Bacteroidota bacterium]|nr:hypothetical protein [Bacteroidota bacterium]